MADPGDGRAAVLAPVAVIVTMVEDHRPEGAPAPATSLDPAGKASIDHGAVALAIDPDGRQGLAARRDRDAHLAPGLRDHLDPGDGIANGHPLCPCGRGNGDGGDQYGGRKDRNGGDGHEGLPWT